MNIIPQAAEQTKPQREFHVNDVRVYTVPEVLSMTNIKARATLDKYIEQGILKPIKKRGRQPTTYRGRRFLFKQEAIEKLKAYMAKHGRITPPGIEKVASKPAKKTAATKVASAPKKTRKAISSKDDILKKLDAALEKVAYLTTVVESLSTDVRKSTQGEQTH